MFGRATITVGIGPHSSFVSVLFAFVMNDRFSFLRSPYGIGQTIIFLSCGLLQRAQCSHCKRCISYSNSVCLSVCPSVTRRYCVKTAVRSKVQFAPLDSKMCLVL